MKAHIGVDSKEGIVHSVCSTAASVADKHMLAALLHGEERKGWGDGAYQGQGEAIRQAAPQAQDMTSRRVKYKDFVDELQLKKNHQRLCTSFALVNLYVHRKRLAVARA